MNSILDIYKIGMGPDSALNIVPYRACREIFEAIKSSLSHEKIHHVEVDLYNEYARLGKYIRVDKDILAGFEGAPFEITIKYDLPTPPAARSPYTFDVLIYTTQDEIIARHRVVSISGGNYMITDYRKPSKYQFQSFQEMIDFFAKHKDMNFFDFCCLFDKKKDIVKHLNTCIELMDAMIDRSLQKTGEVVTFDNDIHYSRRAKYIFENVGNNESESERLTRIVTAYSYAIGEEVPEKCMMVACPTCSSTSIVWSVLRYLRENNKFTKEQIYNALCGSALIASYIVDHASLAASQIGCQGPVGTATGIAAAITANLLYGADMTEMGRAFEMAYEHCLGLICDSVCPLPLVPCIQRCASYATRAIDLAVMNHSLMATEELCKLEDVIKVLNDTGKDLVLDNKRIAMGGFHKYAEYTLKPFNAEGEALEVKGDKHIPLESTVKEGAK